MWYWIAGVDFVLCGLAFLTVIVLGAKEIITKWKGGE